MTTSSSAGRPRRRIRGVAGPAVLVLVAVLLGACGSGAKQSGATPAQNSPGQASAQANGPSTGNAGSAGTGTQAGGAAEIANKLPNLRSEPLVTVPSNLPKIDLQIFEVRRSAGAATVGFALHNNGTDEQSLLFQLGSGTSSDVAGVSLVDPANLKRYLTLKDDKGGCACSSLTNSRIPAGQSVYFYATFTAPPASVTRIVVQTPVGSVAGIPITDV